MSKYNIRVQKVNYGIQIELLTGKLSKNALIAMEHAHSWWKKQVLELSKLPENWFEWKRNKDSDYPPRREQKNVTNLPSKKMIIGYEPVGFVVADYMGDTGSAPSDTRKEVIKRYQRPLSERRVGKNVYFWTDVEIRLDPSGDLISIIVLS